MLNVLSANSGIRLCDGLSRRESLQIGALGTMGLGLPQLLHAGSSTGESGLFGRARRVILLFMWGGPAHQDTWDLKPQGPEASRGEFLPIATNVPGLHISEHFPLIAQHAEKLAIIRSVGQDDNNHSTGAHAGLTGRRHELKAESLAASDTDFPHFGSVLTKLRPNRSGMPTFVALPEVIATTNGAVTPGQGGGLLGKAYDPFQIESHPDRPDFKIDALRLPGEVAASRMVDRRGLLQQIEQTARLAERSGRVESMGSYYQRALDMVLAPEARQAFDLSTETPATRARYGWHAFGQSVLLARRLAEAGVRLVTVYWHRERKTIDTTWDTHARNFEELKNRLMPSVDRPIAALLEDLAASGLLDDTLVVWNSEFGRTPNVNASAGRDHWGFCNSVVMAGGGVPGGQVFGASDDKAAYPVSDKVTQDDIAASIYHLLGIDLETLIHDRLNRPFPVSIGQPIAKLLGGLSRPEARPDPAPRLEADQVGAFVTMLRGRGGRFLAVNLGNAASEKQWTLTAMGAPRGDGINRHRPLGEVPATFKYGGVYFSHFDYGWVVLRLAEPRIITGLQIWFNGSEVPVPEALLSSGQRTLWQVPIPAEARHATPDLTLKIHAPGWPLCDVAVTGDEIRDVHLKMFEESTRL
ncbi:MAG: DUF1501 domain-containing protein [Planctomycetia bacterium]|nr:DUF1501 domain-containing protein [Planctomycetia bacterium]